MAFQAQHVPAVDDTCRDANDILIANDEYATSFTSMLEIFNDNCNKNDCSYTIEPVTSDLTQSWDSLSDLTLASMKTACEFFSSRRVCKVTTVTKFTNLVEIEGVTIFTDIKEDRRPICYPPTCSESEVSIVHPSPANCESDNTNCEVISYFVDCPSRPTSSGSCANDIISSNHLFNTLQTVFQGNILLNCQEALETGSTDLCSLNINQVEATSDNNYEDFSGEATVSHHREVCLNAGGQECFMDINSVFPTTLAFQEIDVTDLDVGELRVEGRFTNLPICLPLTCTDDDLENIAEENFLSNLEVFSGTACGQSAISCSTDVTNIECIKPTVAPSIAPTIKSSSAPSSMPSLKYLPSYFPSNSEMPSSSPSYFPTLPPTNSEKPSLFPSNVSSTSPSVQLSSFPSYKPSSSPTERAVDISIPCRNLPRFIQKIFKRFRKYI